VRERSRVRWAGWTSDGVFHALGTRHAEAGTVKFVRSVADDMTRAIVEAQGRHETIGAPNNSMQLAALRAADDADRYNDRGDSLEIISLTPANGFACRRCLWLHQNA
jgi:hypothetical protein